MCGVIGIYGGDNVVYELYDAMVVLQHRGQDAAGIVTFDGGHFHLHKDEGMARDIFNENIFKRLPGQIGIGHLRYPTVGGCSVTDAQPFVRSAPYGLAMAHNGNLVDFHKDKKKLQEEELVNVNSNCDVELIQHVFAKALRRQKPNRHLQPEQVFEAVKEVLEKLSGAYFVVGHIAGQGMFAFRDPHGIRPGVFGKREGLQTDYIFSSESVVLETLGFEKVSDVAAGEVVFIDNNRDVHRKVVANKKCAHCIFEYVYFARPDSIIDGISVYKARLHMGETLAPIIKKADIDIDVVCPVPDTSRSTAVSLAHELGVKFREGLIKNRYIGRTFIMPGQVARQKSIRYKLSPNVVELKDKNVLLVDDSIVRGNTSKKIIELVRNAGARKVYFAVAAPPLTHPCLYGIDLPSRQEYVANELTIDEIRKSIGADELFYQELPDLQRAVAFGDVKKDDFCCACFNGDYPTGDIDEEMLKKAESDREADRCAEVVDKYHSEDQMPLL
ncbi:MAG: amidophosphoribosyltransferase [Patescibacteria group bacterium]|nr:amidophosphoribosyltransferase [Patescibacteria group bacterium]